LLIANLKNGKENKIINGYPWIFSDEIEKITGEKISGEFINVFSKDYRFLGKGIYSSSNIAIRMLTTKDEEINYDFFERKIKNAVKRRERYNHNSYRLIHGEADGIPGLIVDRYNDFLVVQIRNNGIEKNKNYIIDSLKSVINIKGIYERSDFETNTGEEIQRNTGVVYGEEPPEKMIIDEHGIKYYVDIKKGQKTGFFFDQRDSRMFLRKLVKKTDRVLDAYTFTGGFAFNACVAGAKEVVAIDKDSDSIAMAEENKKINNFNNVEFYQDRYENFASKYDKEKFDIIILDPPSLIKKKTERKKGMEIFKNITEISKPLIKEDGIIGLCSCAYQADIDLLVEAMRRAYFGEGYKHQVLGITYQSDDHPWMIQIPESLYLKCIWVKLSKE